MVSINDQGGSILEPMHLTKTNICVPIELAKNAETSRLLLNRGTKLYKLTNFKGALHYYNMALIFAEKDTQSVGFAYANRAAVLVSLGHFEEATQDIDSALKNKYPESQATKLEQRKDRCLKAIQKKEAEYLAIDPDLRNPSVRVQVPSIFPCYGR